MVELRLELSGFAGRGRHTHGFLSTPKQNVILRLRNDSVIHGTIGFVSLEVSQIDNVVELGGKVGRSGNEEGLFSVEADPVDLLLMGEEFIELLS